MLLSDALRRLLLAGVCLCVCGYSVQDTRKEVAGSLSWRSLTTMVRNWRMIDREDIHKTVLERTPRDAMDDISATMHEYAMWSSSTGAPNPSSPIPGPVMPTPLEPFPPDMGEGTMPIEDSMEGLWTEAPRPSGADTAAAPSQDDATEGTMSSESLPLIFEPLEESPAQPPAAVMATMVTPLSEADSERPVATETDKPPRTAPPMTADDQLKDASGQSGILQTSKPTDTVQAFTPVTMATYSSKLQSGLEEMYSEDDPDEDENSEESLEDGESEEDPTETSRTQPPYSPIPPPPIWVQRNQGLMRSWVAMIREKAGYVSGMLAPVAIGMAGALLLVGVLYSVRRIQRRRRNSFKRQRRKVRPAEQPGETCAGRQDQAMLLVDSSEDEF